MSTSSTWSPGSRASARIDDGGRIGRVERVQAHQSDRYRRDPDDDDHPDDPDEQDQRVGVADVTAGLTLNEPGLDLSLPAISVAINTTNAPVNETDPNSGQPVTLPAQSLQVVEPAATEHAEH